jgi:hypothetical protein
MLHAKNEMYAFMFSVKYTSAYAPAEKVCLFLIATYPVNSCFLLFLIITYSCYRFLLG